MLLDISFETEVDLGKSSRLLIKRHHFLLMYLSTLVFLSKDAQWSSTVTQHFNTFYECAKGSYWNCSVCQKVWLGLSVDSDIQETAAPR